MKKLNLKQPKYVFPLIILLPIVFLAYEISQFTDSKDEPQKGVVTDKNGKREGNMEENQ